MKMRKILVTMLIACACLTACGKEESTQTPDAVVQETQAVAPQEIKPLPTETTVSAETETEPSVETDDVSTKYQPKDDFVCSINLNVEPEVIPVLDGLRDWVNRRYTQSQQMRKPEIGEDYKIIAAHMSTDFDTENSTAIDFCSKTLEVFIQTENGTICEINCNGVYTIGGGYHKSFSSLEDVLEAVDTRDDGLWLSFVEEE